MILKLIPWILQTIAWIPTRIIYALTARFRVRGRKNLTATTNEKGVIFAANHISTHDPIAVRAALPLFSAPLYFVSLESREYRHLPLLRYISGGLFFRLWGAYPVFRGLGDYSKALAYHIKILSKGRLLCMFPHGGINDKSPRPGIGFLAAQSGATIVPTHLSRASGHFEVTFGKPFTFRSLGLIDDGTQETYRAASERIMEKIYELADDSLR